MMTSFTISQSKENFLQEEKDQNVSIVYNKDICIWGNFINRRWLKILRLNYLTSPGCFKCFLSDCYSSHLKTILEHFSSRLCFLHLFIHLHLFTALTETLRFTASSQFCSYMPPLTQSGEESLLPSWKSPLQVACLLRHP